MIAVWYNHEYQVIQEAINASADGDIVLVHPGRYYENINFNGHNITLASFYIMEPIQSYIDSTIIDGNYLGSCIMIENGETAEVSGFTLVNNEEGLNIPLDDYPNNAGGGICVDEGSQVNLFNCIIQNCFSRWGGGVAVCYESYCNFSNVDIRNNRALISGGGIYIVGIVDFDQSNLCSIYNNIAAMGMDIYLDHCEMQLDIILDTFSSMLYELDYFYISEYESSDISITCENSYFSMINSDIYVAPWGNDNNSGLNEDEPLKTIAYAMQIIEPDSLDPKTIHLAEGTYSFSQNNQIFPFAVKSDIMLQGAGMVNTIFDAEYYSSILIIMRQRNVQVSDINIIDCRSSALTGATACQNSSEVSFKNMLIENSLCSSTSGLSFSRSIGIIAENIIVRDASNSEYSTIGIHDYSNDITINNVIIDNLSIIGDAGSEVGLFLSFSNVTVRNTIISNCSAQDAYLIFYQNIEESTGDNNLDLTNTLIFNNNITYTSWAFAEIYLQHRYQTMNIANCTIANNHGFGNMMSVFGMAELSNNIIYNPDMNNQLFLNNDIYGVPYDVVMSNNLVDGEGFYVDLPQHVTYTGNLWNSEPLFAGECYPYLPENIPDYYQLSAESPCIDAGTPDTLGLNIPPMDLKGNERIWNDIIDTGCYEYGAPPHVGNTENVIENGKSKIENYPNPVYLNGGRGVVFLEFTLPDIPIDDPRIEIYNIRGQKVKTIELTQSLSGLARIAGLASRETQRGEAYSTVWNCRNEQRKTVAAGVYFYTLSVAGEIKGANKLLILK
ncbi:MAG: hypothetical protein K9M99_12700 [Candidatus Cloacimonetes bacterium]|nr:hypothetical protein [Candidatus Cloacimonadota bacterium]